MIDTIDTCRVCGRENITAIKSLYYRCNDCGSHGGILKEVPLCPECDVRMAENDGYFVCDKCGYALEVEYAN